MADSWNAKVYSQFLNLRTRPARDLLFAIPQSFQPETVYDLGCGPGNSTIILKDRWPFAKVIGLDSSADMLEVARASYPDICFIQGDIADFIPKKKSDCLFANASLQWLDNHETLIPKLVEFLNPNGVFAMQMPNNFNAPTHQVTLHILQQHKTWQPLLKKLRYGVLTQPFYNLLCYYELLTAAGLQQIQLWQTEYFQQLDNHEAIFEWVKGTGLRPVLSEMNSEQKLQFRDAYIKAIAKAYPLQSNHKVLLPFKRIFAAGIK